MILITGATGQLGKSTLQHLLKKGVSSSQISALVRDEAKAGDLKSQGIQIKVGNYNDYASLVQSFQGVHKLFLISSSDFVGREKQHENAVSAAKEAGVKHIVYTSFMRKNESATSPIAFISNSHIDTEKHLKASGLSYTILKNNLYFEVLPMFLGEKVLETGVFFPAGGSKSAFASREDMAEATAQILASSGHENKEYHFSNSDNVSFAEIAQMLGNITGTKLTYTNPSPEVYVNVLKENKVPDQFIGLLTGFAQAIQEGEFFSSQTDLEKLLGRKALTLKEYLEMVYSKKD